MPSENLIGGYVIAISPRTLLWAADEVAEKLTSQEAQKLDVRAGEHLAAILTTAFLGTAPARVDTTGDVDLWFDLPSTHDAGKAGILPAHVTNAAFEVKSMPGEYRRFESSIDRDKDHGVDATGRTLHVLVRSASDVLREAGPWLLRASNQLRRKTSADMSRNVFLVIHPFDYMTAECIKYVVIAPLLAPLNDLDDLDTVWVLWAPGHLTMWSRDRHEWIDLLFNALPAEKTEAPQPREASRTSFRKPSSIS